MARNLSGASKSIVLLLAETKRSLTPTELAHLVGRQHEWVVLELAKLSASGLVEVAPTGYRLARPAVVGVRGFVGRVMPQGSWG